MTTFLQPLYDKISLLGQQKGLPSHWLETYSHIYSPIVTPLSSQQIQSMTDVIHAIETVIASPICREKILEYSHENAQKNPGAKGVFFSYDFHLTPDGAQLIEINTNAGGAFLATLLSAAMDKNNGQTLTNWENKIYEMFLTEWKIQKSGQDLKQVAIIDDDPENQHFYPELLLFQHLLNSRGIETHIIDPKYLTYENRKLYYDKKLIDLVYNRLTDFWLSAPEHQILKKAYLNGDVVVTPHPYAYALYADKRNLILLSDSELLKKWEIDEKTRHLLKMGIPKTLLVNSSDAEFLWQSRKKLFFKPIAGYGGKGAYNGKSITKRVFGEILHNKYIAQTLVTPSTNGLFKVDVRAYVYQGKILNWTARLYQGQVTNFRTEGGGFSYCSVTPFSQGPCCK